MSVFTGTESAYYFEERDLARPTIEEPGAADLLATLARGR